MKKILIGIDAQDQRGGQQSDGVTPAGVTTEHDRLHVANMPIVDDKPGVYANLDEIGKLSLAAQELNLFGPDAGDLGKTLRRRDRRVDRQLAKSTSNQLGVLRTEVEDEDDLMCHNHSARD